MPRKTLSIAMRCAVSRALRSSVSTADVWASSALQRRDAVETLGRTEGVDASQVTIWLSFAVVVKLMAMMAGVVRWRLLLLGQGLHMPFGYMVRAGS